jgi:hypothetical protein
MNAMKHASSIPLVIEVDGSISKKTAIFTTRKIDMTNTAKYSAIFDFLDM